MYVYLYMYTYMSATYGPRLPMQLAAEHPLQNCNANGLPAMFEDVPFA